MANVLDYASPGLGRRPPRWPGVDRFAFVVGVTQLVINLPLMVSVEVRRGVGQNWYDTIAGVVLNSGAAVGLVGVASATVVLWMARKAARFRVRPYLISVGLELAMFVLIPVCVLERLSSLTDYVYQLSPPPVMSECVFRLVACYPTLLLFAIRLVSPWNSIYGPEASEGVSLGVLPIDSVVMTEKAAKFSNAPKATGDGPVLRSPLDVGGITLNPPMTVEEIVQIVREGRERG